MKRERLDSKYDIKNINLLLNHENRFISRLCVSDKIISKWELSRYPILAKALELSYKELLDG